MNAPFSAVFRTLNGTAASLSALHETLRCMEAETRTALRLNDQNKERRVCAVQDATDELLEDFAHECDTLKGDAESLLSAAEIAMNDILDPHFHRMQPQYFSAAMQKPYNTANVCAEALIARMQKALSAIQAGAKKIKNAFLLPDAAGLIGSVSPDFRKSLYMPILDTYAHMCRCAEAIENAPAFTEKTARAHAVCTRKTRQIEAECTNRRAEILQKLKADTEAAITRTNAVLCTPPSAAIFAENAGHAPLFLGTLRIALPSGKMFIAPLTCTKLDRSVLLLTDNTAPHALFCSLALDLLKSDPAAVVHLADPAHCGNAYKDVFAAFTPSGRAEIWCSAQDFTRGIEALCRAAAENAPNAMHYVFIENMEQNIPEQMLEDLIRLMRANTCVRVLVSVRKAISLPHGFQQKFPALVQNAACCTAKSSGIYISEDVFTVPPEDLPARRAAALSAVTAQVKKAAVLPLNARLPHAEGWQKKSSEAGISLPIGQSDVTRQPVTLAFTEEKPYALVIGDVNSGKSALLHTVALQIFANYTPDEVKLAIADFKEGAEFALYGASRLPAVEAVVENDDPDCAASFLRYYVSELHRRQTCFTTLSAETGRLIRKYETYRAVQRETGALSEILPRILLMIDEYQSLFEGNTETAALLSELVRKGRTYGVHLIMASQRGVSESARNTFTAELKDHFSTRLVFRCPPAAARRLFIDRAVDTGRENTGIAAAVLLKTGHALLNDEAGQTERATVSVQCFYAGDDLIGRMCSLLPRVNGTGETAWLRYNAASRAAPSALPHGEVTFGDSVCLHKDRAASDADSLKDDGLVSFTPNGTHILCTGSDLRVPASVLCSAARFAEQEGLSLHIFCAESHPLLRLCPETATVYTTLAAQREALSRQLREGQNRAVNVFLEMSAEKEFTQPLGTLRPSADAALLKNAVAHSRLSVVFERRCKIVRSELPQLLALAPIHITAVGDNENLRAALPDTARITATAFDVPQKDSIHAYYCNRDTEKWGKIVLFQPFSPCQGHLFKSP